jgi:hypothetical protein
MSEREDTERDMRVAWAFSTFFLEALDWRGNPFSLCNARYAFSGSKGLPRKEVEALDRWDFSVGTVLARMRRRLTSHQC